MNRKDVLHLLRSHRETLAQRFGITELALFGSFARDQATEDSDVDVLVSFDGLATPELHYKVQYYIESLMGRPIDLVVGKELRRELRPYVEAEAIDVFNGGSPMPGQDRPARQWRLYIEDMIEFCRKVLDFTAGLEYPIFIADSRTSFATMHSIVLIGEAATRVPSDIRDANPDVPWSQMIGTRDRIIHGYLTVDDEAVWQIVQIDIPASLPQLRALLETED